MSRPHRSIEKARNSKMNLDELSKFVGAFTN